MARHFFWALVHRHWIRCFMTAIALRYLIVSYESNGPYWDADTAYLYWSTDVPAVTVCYADNTAPVINSEIGSSEITLPLRETILERTKEFKAKSPTAICNKMFKNCSWNEKIFKCCRHFQSHRFIVNRPCFSINSLQTINKMKKLSVSHFSKGGPLIMEFNVPVEITLHDPVEIQFDNYYQTLNIINIMLGEEAEWIYSTRQTIEDASLTVLDFSNRGCLLRDERKLSQHSTYSKSACLLECVMYKPDLYALNSTLCDCPLHCAEIEIKSIWNGTRRGKDNLTRSILTMSKPATERLIMKSKKDYVDLIVVTGCLMQFFTGLSLLDILKYLFQIKKLFYSTPKSLNKIL